MQKMQDILDRLLESTPALRDSNKLLILIYKYRNLTKFNSQTFKIGRTTTNKRN